MLWQRLDFIANDRQVPTTSVVGILAQTQESFCHTGFITEQLTLGWKTCSLLSVNLQASVLINNEDKFIGNVTGLRRLTDWIQWVPVWLSDTASVSHLQAGWTQAEGADCVKYGLLCGGTMKSGETFSGQYFWAEVNLSGALLTQDLQYLQGLHPSLALESIWGWFITSRVTVKIRELSLDCSTNPVLGVNRNGLNAMQLAATAVQWGAIVCSSNLGYLCLHRALCRSSPAHSCGMSMGCSAPSFYSVFQTATVILSQNRSIVAITPALWKGLFRFFWKAGHTSHHLNFLCVFSFPNKGPATQ